MSAAHPADPWHFDNVKFSDVFVLEATGSRVKYRDLPDGVAYLHNGSVGITGLDPVPDSTLEVLVDPKVSLALRYRLKSQTVIVQIGNSDDKLTQAEWSRFIHDMRVAIGDLADAVHFTGYSDPTSSWQNACFVFEASSLNDFKSTCHALCEQYRQDSIAVTIGTTEFFS